MNARQVISETLAAVEISSTSSFKWFGNRVEALRTDSTAWSPTSEELRALLVATLQRRLYQDMYAVGAPVPSVDRFGVSRHDHDGAFLASLAEAVVTQGVPPYRWQVLGIDAGGVVVDADGIALSVAFSDLREAPSTPCVGDYVDVARPLLSTFSSPGYVVVHSAPPAWDRPVVRLYWNVGAAGAPGLTRHVSREMSRRRTRHVLKLLSSPDAYRRCDAAVLYVDAADEEAAMDVARGIARRIGSFLKPAVPCFTRRVVDGLGVADDPGGGASFGMHRCGQLADGIIRAWEVRATGQRARMRIVAETFEAAGVDLDAPERCRPAERR